MSKKEIILSVVFGGLLLKIIKNQQTIDDHIYDNRRGWMYEHEKLSNNTIKAKLYNWYDNIKPSKESK